VRAAVVQAAPVAFDVGATLEKVDRRSDHPDDYADRPGRLVEGKFDFDVAGHSSRPDVFRLEVDERG
jgi:hypothetical protein